MRAQLIEELFGKLPIVGIMRNLSAGDIEQCLIAYQAAGFSMVEITMNTPNATELIRQFSEDFQGKLTIGAGTVCTMKDLNLAVSAGAEFIVSPILDEELVKACVRQRIPVFPGAFSPTEIYRAWEWGATMVKVFPAGTLGPRYIREVLAPLNDIALMPTGGVSTDNLADYVRAGAKGFGIGGQLFDKKLIAQKNWAGLQAKMERFKHTVITHMS